MALRTDVPPPSEAMMPVTLALLLEVAFLERDSERHAVGRAAVISDGDVLCHCRSGRDHPKQGHDG
jgi:hypothetical protein